MRRSANLRNNLEERGIWPQSATDLHRIEKRRGGDSNPRYPCGHTGFRDRPNQPLWHLSERLLAVDFYDLTAYASSCPVGPYPFRLPLCR